ncbi:FAD-dependent monooxygenase [Amycolatopsis sp. H20-H5]|uniref:FAD-dependent monooxygenase n=1 Tax=Amycolatopsis sp. H20-H5 TaxID=3046309 RepID=UPI002DBE5D8B|nr:FAD-dependent monooxygenase [Amycolatopsis sp. H20-H5]MEC3973938.1 FAD-dependent monooxygenase [Amycolatopsis sp. H20-H5]
MGILVIGGGIAGTVTAMALRQVGFDVGVYEAYESGGEDKGAFLTIMHNGMDALRAIGADRPVVENSFAATGVELVSPDNQVLRARAFDKLGPDGPRTLTRSVLYRVLQEEARRRGVSFYPGKRLVSADVSSGGVVARFANGGSAEGELLVGADGLRSVVRTLIDPDALEPRSTGLNVVYGYTRGGGFPLAPGIYRMVQGRNAAFGYTSAPDESTYWFARLPAADGDRDGPLTADRWREQAFAAFEGEPIPAADIIASTGDEVFGGHSYEVPSTRLWWRERLVLVGDAAHAASPAAGQGASMALEDSVVLAQCLRDLPDTAGAFAAYEGLRRGRVERLVAASGGRDADGERGWLYNHHIDWDARVLV